MQKVKRGQSVQTVKRGQRVQKVNIFVMETCIICDQSLSNGFPTSNCETTTKGSDGINRASKARGSVETQVGQCVHIQCRKEFIDSKRISNDQKRMTQQESPSFCTLRSETPQFKFKEHCLFCGEAAKCEKQKRGNDVFPVRKVIFKTVFPKYVQKERMTGAY